MDGNLMQNIVLCVVISALVSIIVDLVADYVKSRRVSPSRRNSDAHAPLPQNETITFVPRTQSAVSGSSRPPALPTGAHPATRPTRRRAPSGTAARALPRSMPSQSVGQGNPNYFPRCPIHRCSNRPHEPQVIFWDNGRNMWRCHRGHYFNS